jgi:hypothetical protein
LYTIDIFSLFIEKSDSFSFFDREERLRTGMNIFFNSNFWNIIFGYGPAAYIFLKTDSFINLYQVLLIETGIVGLTIFSSFLFFQIYQSIQIIKKNRVLGSIFLISILSVLVQFNFIHNYWYPYVWLLFFLNTIEYKLIK